jgi:hypothetical protein
MPCSKHAPRRSRLGDEEQVEVGALDRDATQSRPGSLQTPSCRGDPSRSSPRPEALAHEYVRDAQPIEHRQRPRIQRVTTQLVARKARAVDQAYANTGTREYQRSNAASRARSDDEDV